MTVLDTSTLAHHKFSEPFAAWLADAIHARDLREADLDAGPAVLLPVWVWVLPKISVGRKGQQNGSPLLLPVRVTFAGGSVAATGTEPIDWAVEGLGYSVRGTSRIVGDLIELGVCGPQPVRQVVGAAEVGQVLQAGEMAWWQMLSEFESMVRVYIPRAHSALRSELGSFSGRETPPLLNETDIDVLVDRILLGSNDHPSRAARLIGRCLNGATFRRVDPVRYISSSLRRDAEDEVRKLVGDPYQGAKIRAFAKGQGLSDPAAVLEGYTRAYPGDKMGLDRVESALALASSPSASWSSVERVL